MLAARAIERRAAGLANGPDRLAARRAGLAGPIIDRTTELEAAGADYLCADPSEVILNIAVDTLL